jgi:hypothetical protein
MRVLLVVDRAKDGPGIWAMVWTSADDDPRLLESKHFLGMAALQVWLAGIATRYGRSNITVDWTASLKSDDRLAAAVREGMDAS